MLNMQMGAPLKGARLQKVKDFLLEQSLRMEDDAQYTVCLFDDCDELVGTGSLASGVLKYIAVAEKAQGEGACATIVSELVSYAYRMGYKHLFVFTKPANERQFTSLGFFPMVKTDSVLMLENRRDGLDSFLRSIKEECLGTIGAIVANCNPFTLGHRYLMETAAKSVDLLHIFVLSENRSQFDADVRYRLVKEGTADIANARVHRSADYLISSATFPTYFLKDNVDASVVNADLDIQLFAKRIAPALGITKRFVGTEPFCPVTRAYNERMKQVLPEYGVEVIEIERKDGISASKVRQLLAEGEKDKVRTLVPECTYKYLYGGE